MQMFTRQGRKWLVYVDNIIIIIIIINNGGDNNDVINLGNFYKKIT